jgi:hypothetical protein
MARTCSPRATITMLIYSVFKVRLPNRHSSSALRCVLPRPCLTLLGTHSLGETTNKPGVSS